MTSDIIIDEKLRAQKDADVLAHYRVWRTEDHTDEYSAFTDRTTLAAHVAGGIIVAEALLRLYDALLEENKHLALDLNEAIAYNNNMDK